jgi:hypothetical protein
MEIIAGESKTLKQRGEQNQINKIRVMFQDEGRFGRINE